MEPGRGISVHTLCKSMNFGENYKFTKILFPISVLLFPINTPL